jgi:ribonuclease P/MRP protein subunit POP7
VERGIAEEVRGKEGGQGGEMVYLKATGRAIPRALEIGVHFQGEQDCTVRVEMGSVCAVDDMEVDGKQGVEGEEGGKNGEEEEIPETRIRSLSSVTISVELK